MSVFTRIASWLFGLMLLGLSLFVALETLSRKLFNHSFQGADELGGYALAICGAIAFTVALLERGHVRIDLVHDHLPPAGQALLNWLAALTMAGLGFFFARYGYPVLRDTIAYGSTAATPWATPLIYPQSIWYAALAVFGVVALLRALKASWLFGRGAFAPLNHGFGPKSAQEELEEEIGDLRRR